MGDSIHRRLQVTANMTQEARQQLQKRWRSAKFSPRTGEEAAWPLALVFITFLATLSCADMISHAVAPDISVLLSVTAGPLLAVLLTAMVIRTHKKISTYRHQRRVHDGWVERVAAGDVHNIASVKGARRRWVGTVAAGTGHRLDEQVGVVAQSERRVSEQGSFYASRAWVPFIVHGDDFSAIVLAKDLYLSSAQLGAFDGGSLTLKAHDDVAVIAHARPLVAGSTAEQCWNALSSQGNTAPYHSDAASSGAKPRLVLESSWLRPVLCRLQGGLHSPQSPPDRLLAPSQDGTE